MAEISADRAKHRSWLVGLTDLLDEGMVADLGCGAGEDLCLLAARHAGERVRLVGVDTSSAAVAAASEAFAADARVSVLSASLDRRLPFDDSSVDLVFSHNLLECLPDPQGFAREVARVLKPGGQAVIGHWDWDTQLYDGTDPALVRRMVHAFTDWQQAWMTHSDGWMGRRLWGIFQNVGFLEGTVSARVLTNTSFSPECFGYQNAQAIGALARRGIVSSAEYDRFYAEQVDLSEAGCYFYSITGFAYTGKRPAA